MKQIIFIAILLTCAFGACSSDNDGDEQSASVQAPSDITIERMGKTKVLLRWKDNSNNETGFSILLRKADTSENIEIAKVSANVTEYTIENDLDQYSRSITIDFDLENKPFKVSVCNETPLDRAEPSPQT